MTIDDEYFAALNRFERLDPTDAAGLKDVYESEVMPRAIARIQALAADRGWLREPVDVLLVTAGNQPYSIMLSLALTPARHVGLLCTDDSLPNAERAVATVLATADWPSSREYPRVEKADGVSVYRQILRIHRERNPVSVVVDITSGTKAMTAAASSSAVVIGARQRYVESTQTKHRGWFGREYPHELPHPLTEMGDLSRREAERLFNRGAFEHAAALFSELHQRGAPGYRFSERANLARAYAEIDALRFSEALSLFTDADRLRFVHRGDSVDPLCDSAPRLQTQWARLAELAGGKVNDETLIRYLIAYAGRRAAQGLYDAAALVHYRTVELCIAVRLAVLGIDKDAVEPQALETAANCSASALLARYNELAGQKQHRLLEWPQKLALAQGWTLLRALSDQLTNCVDSTRLLGQTTVRNESIFAHGRRPLSSKSFNGLVALAEVVRAETARLQGWTLPDPDPDFDFVTFDLST